jgi:hypothetical protein
MIEPVLPEAGYLSCPVDQGPKRRAARDPSCTIDKDRCSQRAFSAVRDVGQDDVILAPEPLPAGL